MSSQIDMNRLANHFDSAPADRKTEGSMAGFDSEFTDIVDYILRITYRIWEGKQVGLCHDYYSDDCPVYTIAGVSIGAEEVTQNTLDTLAAFPDRTLKADAIIWGGNDTDGFHTSHRICTHMTNLGRTPYGEATGKEATIAVIAHCIVKDNKIIEEWLVRDNYSLVEQLGFDPHEIAEQQAYSPEQERLSQWKAQEFARISDSANHSRTPYEGKAEDSPESFIRASLQNIWNARLTGDVMSIYAEDAELIASANRSYKGHEEIVDFYVQFLGTLSSLKFSVDYLCSQPSVNGGADVAARWTLMGNHTGMRLYGEPTGEPIFILGESQYQIKDGKIQNEWTVFDELSVLTQVYRARNQKSADLSVTNNNNE